MKIPTWISPLYYISALYDGVLGIAFLVCPLVIYEWLEIPPPNHVGYLSFPAALLILFAIMFIDIARSPAKRRNLIPYGIMLKICYCAVVFWHWASADIPDIWKWFAFVDIGFIVLFVVSYQMLGRDGDVESN